MTNAGSITADACVRVLPAARPNISRGDDGGACLVDCEIVSRRKSELQSCSPADLTTILGPLALDESGCVPLKEWLVSHSKLASFTEEENSAPNILSPKTSSIKRGGRKRQETKEHRFFKIGLAIDLQLPRCELGFRILRKLRNDGIIESDALRDALALSKDRFSVKEIDALTVARTPMGAAKRVVARNLYTKKHPTGLSLRTVQSYYSRYLKKK